MLSCAASTDMGTVSSRSTLHALRRPAASAPNRPRIAIHPMCQTKAKPIRVAQNATWKPRALLFGTLKGFNGMANGVGVSCCLRLQNASGPDTVGKLEKFQAGGGDDMDHSRVRPFQGSPVRSR